MKSVLKWIYFQIFIFTLVPITLIENVKAYNDLASYFPRCHRNDPNLEECLLKATETVKPFLIKGVPEMNIVPVEPFTVPEITLQQGTQALNFKAVLINVLVDGLSKYKFSMFKYDVPNQQFFCKLQIGPIDLKGDYDVTGKILLAPIRGNGKFQASIANANITVYQKVKLTKKKNGLGYLKNVYFNTSMEVSDPKAHLNGLFNDNEELNKVTNTVINDNINELFQEIKPVIEKLITDVLLNLFLDNIMGSIPYDKLYAP